MHYLFKADLKMCSKLIVRGADINYVNVNGCTALHLCVENKLTEAISFLLKKNANPHILDAGHMDCCDKAKVNGVAMLFWQFNNCNVRKKTNYKDLPLLDGSESKRSNNLQNQPNGGLKALPLELGKISENVS